MNDSAVSEYANSAPIKAKDNNEKSRTNSSISTDTHYSDRDHANTITTQLKNEENATKNKKSNITNLLLNNDSISYKKLIIKELKIENNNDEYKHLINGNDKDFNNFVKIKIIKKTQELEELKSQNLDKLNILLDKCMKCDKFDNVTLNKIFSLIHTTDNRIMDTVNFENKVSSLPKSSKLKVPSNVDKKRKLEISNENTPKLASPRGYELCTTETSSREKKSDLSHQFNNSTQPYQLPAPEIPSSNQQTAISSNWQHYTDPNVTYSNTGYIANPQPQNVHLQNSPNVGYYVSQTPQPTQLYSSQAYKTSQNRQYLMVPQPISENLNRVDPNNTYGVENPYYKVPMPCPNFFHQQPLAPPGPQTSPYRQPLPPISKPLKKGHRRTQSASVSFGSYSNNNIEFRSPQTFNNSKPVNFLIHTPKHPPPS